jgi:hypothetical protein
MVTVLKTVFAFFSERGFESHPLRHLEDILPMMREAFRMTKVERESKVIQLQRSKEAI